MFENVEAYVYDITIILAPIFEQIKFAYKLCIKWLDEQCVCVGEVCRGIKNVKIEKEKYDGENKQRKLSNYFILRQRFSICKSDYAMLDTKKSSQASASVSDSFLFLLIRVVAVVVFIGRAWAAYIIHS